ncbi:MAG: M1 family metallopeptidase [Clostridiales bacterium]|jgi:hypothetical protein|nr:M1 family metallopeptidase [Clostridiales bacterium]
MRRIKRHNNRKKINWHVLLWVPVGTAAVVAALFFAGVLPPDAAPPAGALMPAAATPPTAAPTTTVPAVTPAATPAYDSEAEISPATAGRPVNAPSTRYEIAAIVSEPYNRITAYMRVLYENTTPDTLYELVFHLPANAYYTADSPGAAAETKTYYNGFSKGGIIIGSVSLNDTIAYFYVSDDNMRLHVPFIKEIAPGDTAEIFAEFVLDVPLRNARYGRSELGFQLGNCWPILAVYQDGSWMADGYNSFGDPFYSETAEYIVSIAYPAGYAIAATGSVTTKEKNGMLVSTIAAANAREFACMLMPGMRRAEATRGGTAIQSYALSADGAGRGLQLAQQAMAVLEPYLGQYPYPTLTIAQSEMQSGTGMEYPGLIFVQRKLYLPGNEQQLAFTIRHEVAHQWFYGLVGNDQYNAPWIDEAFASYFGLYATLLAGDEEAYRALHKYYIEECAPLGGRIDGALYDYANEYDYNNAVYWRGATLIEALHQEIGEDAFKAGLRLFFAENAYRVATKADIVSAFERACGKELATWFDDRLAAPRPVNIATATELSIGLDTE